MSMRSILFLSSACLVAMFLSVWTFLSGFGLIAAFLVYSLGGTTLMILFTAISFLKTSSKPDLRDMRGPLTYAHRASDHAGEGAFAH